MWLGDNLDLYSEIPDNSIDCIITDPPYGCTALYWDKAIDLFQFWAEIKRICKPHAVIAIFSIQKFTTALIASNPDMYRYELIWEKSMATGHFSANNRPLRGHETIQIFCQDFKGSTYNPQKTQGKPYKTSRSQPSVHYSQKRIDTVNHSGLRHPTTVLKFKNSSYKSPHPSAKPVELLRWLAKTYSNPGDLIFDPFAGSARLAEACEQEKRYFLGIEKEPQYFHAAVNRLNLQLKSATPRRNPNLILWNIGQTLVETKSGSEFPEDNQDLALIPGVKDKLEILETKGWSQVGVSNQGGVTAINPITRNPWITLDDMLARQRLILNKIAPQLKIIYATTHWANDGIFCYRVSRTRLAIERGNPPYRMPGIGMLAAALNRYARRRSQRIIFVGDLEENREAAEFLNIEYYTITRFLTLGDSDF